MTKRYDRKEVEQLGLAYINLLQMADGARIHCQQALAILRDLIAEKKGLDSQEVQDDYEFSARNDFTKLRK